MIISKCENLLGHQIKELTMVKELIKYNFLCDKIYPFITSQKVISKDNIENYYYPIKKLN